MRYDTSIQINNRIIDAESPAYFIADIAANHDGDLSRAKELIWMAKEAGADAAKFQHFKAEKIVSDFGFRNLKSALSHQSDWKKVYLTLTRNMNVIETGMRNLHLLRKKHKLIS